MRPIAEVVVPCPGIMYCMETKVSPEGMIVPNLSDLASDIIGELLFEIISGETYGHAVDRLSSVIDDLEINEQEVLSNYMSELAIILDGSNITLQAYQHQLSSIFASYDRDLRNKIRFIDPNTLGLLFFR